MEKIKRRKLIWRLTNIIAALLCTVGMVFKGSVPKVFEIAADLFMTLLCGFALCVGVIVCAGAVLIIIHQLGIIVRRILFSREFWISVKECLLD